MQIIVLGMHRSGTSALARVLNMLGAYFAPEDKIMYPTSENPKGYWERTDVMQLNDRILQAGNSNWQNVLNFDIARITPEQRKIFYREIQRIIIALDANRPWMLKDPRLCVTFPLWREQLELPICVHVYRNPLQVAHSLHKRDGIPITTGIAMWEAHVIAALNNSRGLPNIQIMETAFMQEPLTITQQLKTELETYGVRGLRMPQAQELAAFIDTKLLHHDDDDAALNSVLNKQQLILWKKLNQDKLFAHEQPFRTLSYGAIVNYKTYLSLRETHNQVAIHAAKINRLQQEVTERSNTINQLRSTHAVQTHELEQLRHEIKQLQHETKQLQQKLVDYTQSSAQEMERCYEKIQHFSVHHTECVQAQTRVIERFAQQQNLLGELKHTIEATFMSWRWKIGDLIVRSIEMLLGRNNVMLAKQRIEQILRELVQHSELQTLRAQLAHITGVTTQPFNFKNAKTVYTQVKQRELDHFLDKNHTLNFSHTTPPQVSIILVLYNRAELTLACLKSLHEVVDPSIEIVIVDNASTDRTSELLTRLHGKVKILHNAENVGFLLACNQAALQCSGEYLLFLNNDAILLPHALTNALQVFKQEAKVGAVGGKLILLDGTLQEAGSIVWQDGSCYGYGRGADPTAAEFMFRRSVDYCSGAFLLVRRDIHTELGGFDTAYTPAYYEETDFCLRLRQHGLDVVYEPTVAVLHYEFASSGTTEQALNLQRRNKITFAAKHATYLANRQAVNLNRVLEARFATQQPRILYIDDRIPHGKYGSGFPRSNFMLKTLAEQYAVTLMPLNFPDEETWDNAYTDIPKRVEIMKSCGRAGFVQFLQARKDYFAAILVSRPHNMEFFIDLQWRIYGIQGGPPLIYDAEALFAVREKIKAQVLGGLVNNYEQNLKQEIALVRWATRVIAVSEYERNIFLQNGVPTVDVIGFALTPQPTMTAYANRRNLLFVGNMDADYSPNVDSILWFIENVFGQLRLTIPDLELILIGSNKSSQLKAIQQHVGVRVLGMIDDLNSYYENCRLLIAPTRFAAGLPYKVYEAAARGLPVVGSELIRTQLGWGEDAILAADTAQPTDFIQQIFKLYQDQSCWQTIRDGALARIAAECAESTVQQKLLDVVGQTLGSGINAKPYVE